LWKRVASDLAKLQYCTSFFDVCASSSTIAVLHQFSTIDPHFMWKAGTAPQKICISPGVCTSDTHDLRRGSPFNGWALAAPAAKRKKIRRTWEIGVL
jgi:hypothetical protein